MNYANVGSSHGVMGNELGTCFKGRLSKTWLRYWTNEGQMIMGMWV